MAELTNRADVAVIVPVHGDTGALTALLATIEEWATLPREIIVVSTGGDAGIASICRQRGCRHLEATVNRGARLDRGARTAVAPVLWFLHADATPAVGSLQSIAGAIAEGAESGCFRFRFLGARTWYKALLERLIALRVAAGGIAYGDQGLFALREAYLACGGFAHEPLFEEVTLVKRLRARGTFRPLSAPIGVSPRRWERDGWWRRTLHNRSLALCHALGVSAERLARRYRRPLRSGEHEIES